MAVLREAKGSRSLIPVARQPEPATFMAKVRTPGRAFLRKIPKPTKEEWRKGQFWTGCLPDLRSSYRHICAYCCFWLTMEASVDHYFPKSVFQQQAYEWNNYRLAHPKLN